MYVLQSIQKKKIFWLLAINGSNFEFLSQFFWQSPMECSSNCVFEVYFSKKQAITRIGFRPGFAPNALNWGKAMKIQPVHSTCRTVHLRFKTQLSYLFWTLFQVSNLAALAKSPNTGALQGQRSTRIRRCLHGITLQLISLERIPCFSEHKLPFNHS